MPRRDTPVITVEGDPLRDLLIRYLPLGDLPFEVEDYPAVLETKLEDLLLRDLATGSVSDASDLFLEGLERRNTPE